MSTKMIGDKEMAIQINPQNTYINKKCYADSKCMELIGRKYNDYGTEYTLFYQDDNYPGYKFNEVYPPPSVSKRLSSDLVWIIVPIIEKK